MNATLSPDVIHRTIVLKQIDQAKVEFDPLIPTSKNKLNTNEWFKPEAVSQETDDIGQHVVIWHKGKRHAVYRGDAIFPVGPEQFLIVREEIVSYLRPAFHRMLDAEGYEPSWITEEVQTTSAAD